MKTITITRDISNEYRVPGPDGREATAYYTDDRQDAMDTLKSMYGNNPLPLYRTKRVEEHPQGR